MKILLADTETTGINDPEVIELAHVAFNDDLVLQPQTLFQEFYKPTKQIEWGALATHHILQSDLEGMRPAAEARLPASCQYLIGHNIDFDWKALGQPKVKRVCTMALARDAWPHLDSHKLAALYYYTQGCTATAREAVKQAHGAAADIILAAKLLATLLDHFQVSTIEALWRQSEESRLPKIMPFGKFKGQPIENVDRGWISWYRRQEDTDPYLLAAFGRLGR